MVEYDLRYRLMKNASEAEIYGWNFIQQKFQKGNVSAVIQEWSESILKNEILKECDAKPFYFSEGGLGTVRKIRNVSRIQENVMYDFNEIWFRSEGSPDGSLTWSTRELRLVGNVLKHVIENFLNGDNCVDFYLVVNDTLSSDEESSHYEGSDDDTGV